jgi:hypothetical protein
MSLKKHNKKILLKATAEKKDAHQLPSENCGVMWQSWFQKGGEFKCQYQMN